MRSARLIDWVAALALCAVLLATYYLIESRAWFIVFAAILVAAAVVWLQRRASRRTLR